MQNNKGKAILFASGKGGVGKSTLSAALGVALASRGQRVLLLDGDLGLRNLDLILGLQDTSLYELADCMERRCTLEEAIVVHKEFHTLYLLSGGQQARPKDFAAKDLARVLRTLKKRYDYLLIDGPAGIGGGFKSFLTVADHVVLIATPDTVCLRDTEKVAGLVMQKKNLHPDIVLNRYAWPLYWAGRIPAPQDIALSLDLPLLGVVPQSDSVYVDQLSGITMAQSADTEVTDAINRATERLLGLPTALPEKKEAWFDRLRRRIRKERVRV